MAAKIILVIAIVNLAILFTKLAFTFGSLAIS